MLHKPLRFIHAADLLLDLPLEETGPLPAGVEDVVLTATLRAFENVVEHCLRHEVDFLLLSGNSFVADDRSLAAYVALERGLARLGDAGISTFVTPAAADPPEAWQPHVLPDCVTVFNSPFDGGVEWTGDNRPAALIAPVAEQAPVEQAPTRTTASRLPRSFTIGMLMPERAAWHPAGRAAEHGDWQAGPPDHGDFRYLALGGLRRRITTRGEGWTAHFPGGTQGIVAEAAGPHGCSLITVDGYGMIEITLLPTAPVRRETEQIAVNFDTTRDDLLELMLARHERYGGGDCERVRLLHWTIHGSGPLLDDLQDDAFQADLLAACHDLTAVPAIQSHHTLHVQTASPPQTGDAALRFVDALDRQQPHVTTLLAQVLQERAADVPRLARLQHELEHLDGPKIVAHARQLGLSWLNEKPEEQPR